VFRRRGKDGGLRSCDQYRGGRVHSGREKRKKKLSFGAGLFLTSQQKLARGEGKSTDSWGFPVAEESKYQKKKEKKERGGNYWISKQINTK